MKALVTGGAGFIGSHIADKLIQLGHKVVIIDNLSTGNIANIPKEAKFYHMSILDKRVLDVCKRERPDVIFHQAAQIQVNTSIKDPMYDAHINIMGTISLLEACKEVGVKKIIYASSAAIYGDPTYIPIDEIHPTQPLSFYGISKFTPENYVKIYSQMYNLSYTILRYANVYGIRQDPRGEGGVISIFTNQLVAGEPLTVFGDGEQTRDYIYVEDIAEANIKALDQSNSDIYNIGTGTSTSLNQMINQLEKITQGSIRVVYSDQRKGDIKNSYFSVEKACNLLKWSPTIGLEEGLSRTYEYYLNNGKKEGRPLKKPL